MYLIAWRRLWPEGRWQWHLRLTGALIIEKGNTWIRSLNFLHDYCWMVIIQIQWLDWCCLWNHQENPVSERLRWNEWKGEIVQAMVNVVTMMSKLIKTQRVRWFWIIPTKQGFSLNTGTYPSIGIQEYPALHTCWRHRQTNPRGRSRSWQLLAFGRAAASDAILGIRETRVRNVLVYRW